MSTLELLSLAIGLPGAIFGFAELWRTIVEWRNKAEQVNLGPAVKPDSVADRVIIAFRRENVEKAGTWEHAVTTFVRRLPRLTFAGNRILIHPSYYRFVAGQNKALAFGFCIFSLLFLVYIAVIVGYLAPPHRYAASPLSMVFDGLLILFFSGAALGALLLYRRWWRIDAIAAEYEKYFKDNEINIDVEITQSRRMFESRQQQSDAPGTPRVMSSLAPE